MKSHEVLKSVVEAVQEESRQRPMAVCSQNSSPTSDEPIAGVEAIDQAASRQAYR